MANEQGDHPVDVYPDQEADAIAMQGKLNEHTGLLAGVVRIGRVVAPGQGDSPKPDDIPRVMVHIGGDREGSFVRNWLPWVTSRAGFDGEWWAPEEEEQVLVVAPSGNVSLGYIVGAIYRQSLTFERDGNGIKTGVRWPDDAGNDHHIHTRIYKDGSRFSYDRVTHQLKTELKQAPDQPAQVTFTCSADNSVELAVGETSISITNDGAVTVNAAGKDITLTGNVKVVGTLDVIE